MPAVHLNNVKYTLLRVQAHARERRQAADAALESTLHLARWAGEPPQSSGPSQRAANRHKSDMVRLLAQIVGTTSGAGSVSKCLCAAATAAAGQRQLQRFTSGLADVLAAAATQRISVLAAQPLAAVARALRYACGGFWPSCADEGTRDSSNSGDALSRSNAPVTAQCAYLPQGAQLMRPRVTVPAAALTLATSWFDGHGLVSRLLQRQVGVLPSVGACRSPHFSW